MTQTERVPDRELRRHARLDIALAVSYAIHEEGAAASEMAETLSSDISATGLRLMTVASLENGAILNLEIALPDQEAEPIRAVGEVVWQSKITEFSYETGAVIKHMEETDKVRLMGFVFDQMTRLVGTFGGNSTNGPMNPTLN